MALLPTIELFFTSGFQQTSGCGMEGRACKGLAVAATECHQDTVRAQRHRLAGYVHDGSLGEEGQGPIRVE